MSAIFDLVSWRVQDVWALAAGGTAIINAFVGSPKRMNQVSNMGVGDTGFRRTAEGWCVMSLEPKSAADASMGELMSQLSSQTARLVRDEMRLAQKEFQESAKHAGIGGGLLGAAGLLAFFGAATLITAAIAGLAVVLDNVWAAALIVAAVLFIAAGVAALFSKKQVDEVGPPRQTVENVQKDIDEVKGARHDRT